MSGKRKKYVDRDTSSNYEDTSIISVNKKTAETATKVTAGEELSKEEIFRT